MVVEGNCSLDVVREMLVALRRNNFEAIYVKKRQQVLKKILELIPSKAVVGVGDSLTLKQIGVFEELETREFAKT